MEYRVHIAQLHYVRPSAVLPQRLWLKRRKDRLYGSTKQLISIVCKSRRDALSSTYQLPNHFDAIPSVYDHVARTAQTGFKRVWHLLSVRRQFGRNATAQLLSALVLAWLDSWKAVLAEQPAVTWRLLQRVVHSAAGLVLNLNLAPTKPLPWNCCTGYSLNIVTCASFAFHPILRAKTLSPRYPPFWPSATPSSSTNQRKILTTDNVRQVSQRARMISAS